MANRSPAKRMRTAAAFLAVALGAWIPAGARATTPEGAAAPPALYVLGEHIVDATGTPVQLNGVNRSGTEYACAQGWGIFDGPSDAASIAAMATWHVNVVRVPLNEDCWLGINGVNPAYGGANYRNAIRSYVGLLEAAGMNVILELHISAPGSELALTQQKMPDADHSPTFWRWVAKVFGADRAVIFDLFNEPHDISWSCWRDGCTVDGWQAVGLQGLVTTVRRAGARNVLMIGGNGWAGDLTQWKAYMPSDPRHQLVASWHNYDFGGCVDVACWDAQVAGVGGAAPILFGEIGETDCLHTYVDSLMAWADGQAAGVGIGYLAWTWDTWGGCLGPTVIINYDGTPSSYGVGVRDHFVARFPPP